MGDKKEAVEKANLIEGVNGDVGEIEDVERIVNSQMFSEAVKGKKYVFYTERWLDELMDEMIESFLVRYNFLEG